MKPLHADPLRTVAIIAPWALCGVAALAVWHFGKAGFDADRRAAAQPEAVRGVSPRTPAAPSETPSPGPARPLAPSKDAAGVRQEAAVQPARQPIKYPVSQGETIDSIAKAFLVSPETLLKTNRMTSEDKLRPGMVLLIPLSD